MPGTSRRTTHIWTAPVPRLARIGLHGGVFPHHAISQAGGRCHAELRLKRTSCRQLAVGPAAGREAGLCTVLTYTDNYLGHYRCKASRHFATGPHRMAPSHRECLWPEQPGQCGSPASVGCRSADGRAAMSAPSSYTMMRQNDAFLPIRAPISAPTDVLPAASLNGAINTLVDQQRS